MTQDAAISDPDTVTLTIDGKSVEVPKGTKVIEAAKLVGVNISAFCYHPGLSIAACCRQCLVSIEKSPKLQPSCQSVVAEGMVVKTEDAESTLARKQMLEFTLVNHPIDCPICDKAGECTLQQLYFDHDNAASRVDVPKVQKPKVVDLGPHIVLDAERCILCTRCIRVCDEVAGEHQLEISNRGDHAELGTAPGAVLDNPYSINTVDVCPVGALTSKDYRFKMRAWELMLTPSICPGCSTGCNVEVHHQNERVWRLQPRHNPDVNHYWMCDDGRFTYHALRENRLTGPVVDGLPASWDRALSRASEQLARAMDSDRGAVGVVFSAAHSNEANFVLAKLAADIWQLERLYVGGHALDPEFADDTLREADRNTNTAGLRHVLGERSVASVTDLEKDLVEGKLRALLVLGSESVLSDDALQAAGRLDALVVVADREVGLAEIGTVVLASAGWVEEDGTVTNKAGRTQRRRAAYAPVGQAQPAWQVITRLAQASDAAIAYDHPRNVFEDMVKAGNFDGAQWGRNVRPIQLRFAGSRG